MTAHFHKTDSFAPRSAAFCVSTVRWSLWMTMHVFSYHEVANADFQYIAAIKDTKHTMQHEEWGSTWAMLFPTPWEMRINLDQIAESTEFYMRRFDVKIKCCFLSGPSSLKATPKPWWHKIKLLNCGFGRAHSYQCLHAPQIDTVGFILWLVLTQMALNGGFFHPFMALHTTSNGCQRRQWPPLSIHMVSSRGSCYNVCLWRSGDCRFSR